MKKVKVLIIDLNIGKRFDDFLNVFAEVEAIIPPQEHLFVFEKVKDFITSSDAYAVFLDLSDEFGFSVNELLPYCSGKEIFDTATYPDYTHKELDPWQLKFPRGPLGISATDLLFTMEMFQFAHINAEHIDEARHNVKMELLTLIHGIYLRFIAGKR